MCSDLYNNHPNKQHWGPVLSKEEGGRVKFTRNTSIQQLLQLLIQPLPSVYTWGQLNHDVVVSFPHSPWVRALREETFKFLSYKLLGVLGWWARKGYGENRISNCFTSSSKWSTQALAHHIPEFIQIQLTAEVLGSKENTHQVKP